jgi:hypothetical protein
MDNNSIQIAIDQLLRSERGRAALEALYPWMASHPTGLDVYNWNAILGLLNASRTRNATTCDMIREAMEGTTRSNAASPTDREDDELRIDREEDYDDLEDGLRDG